jgi:hypothetical protein
VDRILNEKKSSQFCYDRVAALAPLLSPNVLVGGISNVMQDAVLYNIFKIPATFGLRGGARPATVTLANLVAFAFSPVFILRILTIDCEHEHY